MSDLLLVNDEGEVVEGLGAVNRAGFYIHSAVHRVRPDVVAAAHTHSLYGKAFASPGKSLSPITQDAAAFYNDLGLHRGYGGVAGYREEGERIAQAIGESKGAILQNHGLITCGHSVRKAHGGLLLSNELANRNFSRWRWARPFPSATRRPNSHTQMSARASWDGSAFVRSGMTWLPSSRPT